MRNLVTACIFGSVLLLGLGRQLASAADADTIKVDLKAVKFNVKPEVASLFGYNEGEEKVFYYAGGPGEAKVKIPADGEYEITIKASCDPAQNERAKFKVSLGGEAVGKETLLTADEAKEYKLTGKAKAGEQKLVIEYTNDVYKENEYDRNFYLHAVTLKKVK